MEDKKIESTREYMKELLNANEEFMRSVVGLLAANEGSAMLLMALYLKDETSYGFFSNAYKLGPVGQTLSPFDEYIEFFKDSEVFRKVIRESGVLERQIPEFIQWAYDGYDMWYHLLDGIDAILADRNLAGMLTLKDRRINEKLFELFKADMVDEYTWDGWFRKFSDLYEYESGGE